MEYKEMLHEIKKEAERLGFSDWEVYYLGGTQFEVLLLEGEISNFENSQENGIAFRGSYQGRTGYAYTERLEEDAVGYLVRAACENALLFPQGEEESLFAGEEYPTFNGYAPSLTKVSVEKRIAMAKRMENAALDGAETIASLDYCVLGMGEREVAITNRAGLDVSYKRNFATGYVSAIAKQGEETKTGSFFWKGRDWSDFDPEATGRKAAENAARLLGAKTVASGQYAVIIEGRGMTALLGAFAPIFFGENVQKGFSLLEGKLGEKVASGVVTLRDDALLEGGYASIPFDSEGVAGRNKEVITKGILSTFLHNRKSGKKDGVSSTGNGFRAGLTGAVKTACTNFYLEQGADSLDILCKKMGDGLYITSFMGLHAGTNAVSGDFSLSAQGFLVEAGEISHSVEQITVAGNFYQLLQEILEVGNDLYFSANGIGSPSLWVKALSVAGE